MTNRLFFTKAFDEVKESSFWDPWLEYLCFNHGQHVVKRIIEEELIFSYENFM